MKKTDNQQQVHPLDELCITVKNLVLGENLDCEHLLYRAMEQFPHAPHPHNLLGIILEKKGNHLLAMKHFRAAWALDPTYRPASHNLETYGTFISRGKCAFHEDDIPLQPTPAFENKEIGI